MTNLFRHIFKSRRRILLVLSITCAIVATSCGINLNPLNLKQANSQLEQSMSAFLIFNVTVKDRTKWAEYLPQAGATIGEFGGELLIRGTFEKMMPSDGPEHELGGVIRFPSVEAIDKWYTSDTYSPLIPLRDEAAEVTQAIYMATN